jgi:hypothetical protein
MVIKYCYARLDLAAFGVPKDGTGSRRDVGLARKILSVSDEFLVVSNLKYVARLLLQSNSKMDCRDGSGMALQVSAFDPIYCL